MWRKSLKKKSKVFKTNFFFFLFFFFQNPYKYYTFHSPPPSSFSSSSLSPPQPAFFAEMWTLPIFQHFHSKSLSFNMAYNLKKNICFKTNLNLFLFFYFQNPYKYYTFHSPPPSSFSSSSLSPPQPAFFAEMWTLPIFQHFHSKSLSFNMAYNFKKNICFKTNLNFFLFSKSLQILHFSFTPAIFFFIVFPIPTQPAFFAEMRTLPIFQHFHSKSLSFNMAYNLKKNYLF